ncbi:2-oxoglutarate dehydrogenase E1 component [Niabella drilacis]|uniref:oxoglutarate dehydrogenase (succinyl-transferring) n=1 Tax=Niabella drilacis (strain DSM 25811 / CCM 8410 / CCUG 62505 / LMG 26954 / E90) TaxID=1285928 RepID=A0A1G6KUE2_NIADE|nr:2-oxoglutarate dehydrogenase E1 component [Niabella drilacis]SDC33986.1 2-oxoglutarate dehydrogenase E1 component [Niabella drilacis]
MKDFSYITSSSPEFIENMYREFVTNPDSVDTELKKFFEGFDFAVGNGLAQKNGAPAAASATGGSDWRKEIAVYRLILGYRNKGHLLADTNPIKQRKDRGANLDLPFFGLSEADLDTEYEAGNLIGLGTTTLKNILLHLKKCYAGHVGIEFKYISDQKKVDWLTNEMEKKFTNPLPLEQKKRILQKLNEGVMFEKFLHTKYVGQKRFSLEGGETTIAALDAIINKAATLEVREVVIGMAHRGRLNVLANILGKTYEQIFSEFEGTGEINQTMGSGDVKYHLGFGSVIQATNGETVHLKLMPNPSHLEAVDPVVLGFARSSANILHDERYESVLPILIHGDAAVAGQGVVYELLQMSKLNGFYTGGTIHFVINNQIGFTTDFSDARSADYCTSLAAMVQSPVLHVNGDDPEAVVKCAEIAARYRNEFHADVFIDMVCYRRHGHNEGDDPKFTQPAMYALIDKHANPREVYVKYLLDNGEEDAKELAKEMEKKFWADLQDRLDEVKQKPLPYTYQEPELQWKSLRKATSTDFDESPDTAISKELFKTVFDGLMAIPEGFTPLKKVAKLLQDKVKLLETEQKVDWATGELMAFGSLLMDGFDVRMTGQDVGRGTFSSRHAILRDEVTDTAYNRLSDLPTDKKFRIFNSLLSEYAVLGFEYGFALASPNVLVLWEAQFGDFVNGAQTMIDQFITSAEQKWNRMNGLVMLLPHGFEGQGPEHSSARIERFLQSCAEMNIVVTNITTSANYFHALRRQLKWPFRKPLVNFAPKANLRHPGSYSLKEEFTDGKFRELIDDAYADDPVAVKTVLFCSGKIYFDLAEKQQKDNRKNVAVVRLEQLYPLPKKQLDALYAKYKNAVWYWVQEEPLNMGAASFLQMNLKDINYGIIGRKPSAAPASGFMKVHKAEQEEIINTAFSM